MPLGWHASAERSVQFRNSMTLFVGAPGTGKSALAHRLSWKITGKAPRVIRGQPGVDDRTIWGNFQAVRGETRFEPGPAHVAARDGLVLIVEDVTFVPLAELANLLQYRDTATFENPVSGDVFTLHPDARLIATANPTGSSCRRDQKVMEALEDAMHVHVVPDMDQQQVSKILERAFPAAGKDLVAWAVSAWNAFRKLAKQERDGEPVKALSVRCALRLLERVLAGEDRAEAIRVSLVNQYWRDTDAHEAANLHLQMRGEA